MKKWILAGCAMLVASSLVGCAEMKKGFEDGMGKGSNSEQTEKQNEEQK